MRGLSIFEPPEVNVSIVNMQEKRESDEKRDEESESRAGEEIEG